MDEVSHKAYLLLGSNIEAEANIRRAIQQLGRVVRIEAVSMTWETLAAGSAGPNFLNTAVEITTGLNVSELKHTVLRPIEQGLGRIRTRDKNAPRTIDLDIIVFDGEICDSNLWLDVFRALPAAELLPDLRNPLTGLTLSEAAKLLQQNCFAMAHPELNNLFKQA
jgi:2-amino-4-hydroxy-6-hydroxymethyldihydropteridine diphosphokinase